MSRHGFRIGKYLTSNFQSSSAFASTFWAPCIQKGIHCAAKVRLEQTISKSTHPPTHTHTIVYLLCLPGNIQTDERTHIPVSVTWYLIYETLKFCKGRGNQNESVWVCVCECVCVCVCVCGRGVVIMQSLKDLASGLRPKSQQENFMARPDGWPHIRNFPCELKVASKSHHGLSRHGPHVPRFYWLCITAALKNGTIPLFLFATTDTSFLTPPQLKGEEKLFFKGKRGKQAGGMGAGGGGETYGTQESSRNVWSHRSVARNKQKPFPRSLWIEQHLSW